MKEKLAQIGDTSEIINIKPVTGGDINQAYYVETSENVYFVKANQQVPANFFQSEAEGLEEIRATNTVHVPKVYHYDIAENKEKIFFFMEWIEGTKNSETGKILGEEAAKLHAAKSHGRFGLDKPTFVGQLPQHNEWYDSWIDYYREKRLQPQLQLGIQNGRITNTRREHLEQLIAKLDHLLPAKPYASLLHGDLWGGNWLTGKNGVPYLIDPSILYGDHLFELAFTELFGGFPDSFYDSYRQVYPLADYYEDVKALYQLFYLLVHLNMFGEGYGNSVDRILSYYIGDIVG